MLKKNEYLLVAVNPGLTDDFQSGGFLLVESSIYLDSLALFNGVSVIIRRLEALPDLSLPLLDFFLRILV